MLLSSVVFLPRFLGISKEARSPTTSVGGPPGGESWPSRPASVPWLGPSAGFEGTVLLEELAVAFDGGTVDAETAGALGPLGTPFFTDSTIFSLRSSEYALMHSRYPAHHHRNPL